MSALCNEMFFYLFGLKDNPSSYLIQKAEELYPNDTLVRWFLALNKGENISNLDKKEVSDMLNNYFPEKGLMDQYFKDLVN